MYTLNIAQKGVVDSHAKHILVLAGAGTGKTATVISKIEDICKTEDPTGRSILALTFTNAAAFEMRQRFRSMTESNASPEFRTFHSFCYQLICHDPDVKARLGFKYPPVIADPGTEGRAKTKARLQVKCKLSDAKIEGKVPLTPIEEQELKYYNKALQRLMAATNTITFDLLQAMICNLFINNDSSVRKYKEQYKYIICDEFQDTDPKQWEFIKSFKDSSVILVGDALQSIYAFRNANPDIIKELSIDPDWEVHKLYENYRSTQKICDFANDMSTYADDAYRIEIQSTRDGNDVVEEESFAVKFKVPVDPKNIQKFIDDFPKLDGTTAILCRTNNEVDEVARYLTESGIVFSRSRSNDESKFILNAVKSNEYAAEWLATFLPSDKYAEYIRLCDIEDKKPIEVILHYYSNEGKISSRLVTIDSIRKLIRKTDISTKNRISEILKLLGKNKLIFSVDDESSKTRSILEYISDLIDENDDSELYIGTIHSSKGLEYNNVYLIGVNDIQFRLDKNDEKSQNMNLYYVGITRARNNLTIFYRREPIPDEKKSYRKNAYSHS